MNIIIQWILCFFDKHTWGEEVPHPKPMPLMSIHFRNQCTSCGRIKWWRRGGVMIIGGEDHGAIEPIPDDGWSKYDN